MSTEIKNTLFRFVSMRAPELTDENQQQDGFIFRDDTVTKGVFDTAVASLNPGDDKWQAMRVAAETYDGLSLKDIKELSPELYKLSIWVAKNRQSYTEEALLQQIEGVLPIEDKEVLGRLWDNLFYQILTQKEFYVKETIIQLLIANHVLTYVNPEKIEQAKALLNARVVLPKLLFSDNGSESAMVAKKLTDTVKTPPTDLMSRQQKVAQAEQHNMQLNQLASELKKAEKAYQKEYSVELAKAEDSYQKDIQPILDQYQADVESERSKWCEIKDPNTVYDPKDPCNKPQTVPEPKLPKFTFEFRKELDYEFLQSRLSDTSFDTLSNLLTASSEVSTGTMAKIDPSSFNDFVNDYEGFADVDGLIHEVISGNNETISDNTEEEGNTLISIGGVVVPVDTGNNLPDFSYQLCSKPMIAQFFSFKYNADLTLTVPDASWNIASFDYTLHRLDQDYSNNGQVSYGIQKIGNTIILKNINLGDLYLADQAQLESFSGTITFTNGVVKTFSTPDFVLRTCTSGFVVGEIIDPNDGGDTSNPGANNETPFIPSGFGMKQLGIADYNKVEQTTQGYVEGDVAHIENVMAREFKERITRRLRRKEDTFTTSSETEKEQLTDTTSTERFEMQNEVAKLIQNSRDFSAGASVNAHYGTQKMGVQIGANANYATHNSREESTRQAVTNAKDLTERALDRIVTKVKEERIEKIVEEFEENNSHGFDNRKGDKHVVGVFRWVDKVFKNQIINYGKRLMFEFMVPQPGKLHKLGMSEIDNQDESLLVEPTDPRKSTTQNLKDFSMLTDAKLKYWTSKYNVEVAPKPKQYISAGASFNINLTGGSKLDHTESNSGSGKITIPEGYKTYRAVGTFNASSDYDTQGNILSLTIGNATEKHSGRFHRYTLSLDKSINDFVQEVPVSYTLGNHVSGDVTATVKCELTTEYENRWKQETFKAIIDAYEEALAAYNERLAEEKASGVEIKGTNPGFYREFENKILRKNCISYIIDQNPSAKNTYGKSDMFTTTGGGQPTFGNLEVNVNQNLDDYAAFVKFMEQAFEWDIMSYYLYPYYWGNRQDWSSLYQYDETNDPLFRNFMQAGMARVIVTVRPGFEEAVRYYMQTGQIWNGGEVPVIEDELYLSIVDELRQPKGEKLGKAWPTRVPTALTILQAQSIGLNVTKALPSLDDLSDFENPEEVPQSQQLELNDAAIGISEGDEIRHIENIDIVDGNLQLNTDDTPRQVVAQISIEALKNAIDQVV